MEQKIKFFNLLVIFGLAACLVGIVAGVLGHQVLGIIWALVAAGLVVYARVKTIRYQENINSLNGELDTVKAERDKAVSEARLLKSDLDEQIRVNALLTSNLEATNTVAAASPKRVIKRSSSGKKKLSEIKEAVKDIVNNGSKE